MHIPAFRRRLIAIVSSAAFLVFSGAASADPPSRVARLGYMNGAVSFSPAGENQWDQATINRPLTTGDRLWTDTGARAEVQVGGAMIRMDDGTGISVLNLDDRIAQLQLTQGTLNVRVRRLEPGQVFEVDTPNLAFTLNKPGEYRIEVDPDGNATTIFVRKGQGEVYGDGAAYTVDSRQPYRFTGTDLSNYEYVDTPRIDEFDRWASGRDRSYDNSSSARYVSQDVVGYQDLDANGTWRVDASYGNVWVPNRVAADWAPYRDGHWAWVDPWGWTWVDDAPWGFAVSHYGRWANMRGTWGWVPGPVRTRAYYAPALVAFVGGDNFQLTISSGNVGGVAWFPLAPREVYRPAYRVSRDYYENINRSNTVINNTVINNTYNNTNVTNVTYVNRAVPGAVVAMPTTAFVQSQRVARAEHRVSRESIANAPVIIAPLVAPTEKSVRGASAKGDQPPPRVFERPVVAHSAPPASHAGFAAQQPQLATQPGKPLDDAKRKELKPAGAAPVPVVKLVAPTKEAPRTLQPPPPVSAGKPEKGRGKSDEHERLVAPPPTPAVPTNLNVPNVPETPKPVVTPTKAPPPLPAAPTPDKQGKEESREPATARPVQPQFLPPPAPRAPAAQPPDQNGKAGQGDKDGKREPVAEPAHTPAPATAPHQVVQPQAKPPVSVPATHAPQRPNNPGQREQTATQPPPPQRAAEPKPIIRPTAPQAPAVQAPPQQPVQPREVPTQVAPAKQQQPEEAAGQQQPKRTPGRENDRKKDCGDKENCEK